MRQKRVTVILTLMFVAAVSPAPGFVARATPVPVPPGAPAVAAAPAAATQDPSAVEAALDLNRPTRRRIQEGLKNKGFAPGALDGLFGPQTRAAIQTWQASRGYAETGHLDDVQAEALREAGPSGSSENLGASVPSPAAKALAAPARCAAWNTRAFFETASVKELTACLDAGADAQARDRDARTPLHWAAASSDNPAVVEALLAVGADVAAQDDDGVTPVHLAARHNSNAAVVQHSRLLRAFTGPTQRTNHPTYYTVQERPLANTHEGPHRARPGSPVERPWALMLLSPLPRLRHRARRCRQPLRCRRPAAGRLLVASSASRTGG